MAVGPAGKLRPKEAMYADELYRAFYTRLKGPYAQSEWTGPGDSQGSIDFRVIVPIDNERTEYWGFECLRDEDRFEPHAQRFYSLPPGRYWDWIANGHLTQYVVVNFTTKKPVPAGCACFLFPNYIYAPTKSSLGQLKYQFIYHAVFSEDWCSIDLYNYKGDLIDHSSLREN